MNSGRSSDKPLIMYKGYTYSQKSKFGYYCSARDQHACKIRIFLDKEGNIRNASDCEPELHNHSPPHYFKTASGKYVKLKGNTRRDS